MAQTKILIDGARLAKVRARAGLTQEQLAEKLETSKRTVQRLEDADTNSRLSFVEMSKISQVLRVWMSTFWGELPLEYEVHGIPIVEADEFSKQFDKCVEAGRFDIEHMPNDEEIETASVNLSKLFDKEKQQLPYRNERTGTEKLEHTVLLRKLFRTCTSNNKVDKIDFYILPTSFVDIAPESEDIVWQYSMNIIGVSAGKESGTSRTYITSNWVCQDTDQEGYPLLDGNGRRTLSIFANEMGGGEPLKKRILEARSPIVIDAHHNKPEYFQEYGAPIEKDEVPSQLPSNNGASEDGN
jgi:transcriptional regulator with XRE-family HTH domain